MTNVSPHAAADWKALLEHGLATADLATVARVPKTDLHCHALLSAPRATYAELLGAEPAAPPRRFASFPAFSAYIFQNLLPALTSVAAIRCIVRGTFDRMIAEGVVYAEPSFDLTLPDFFGISPAQLGALIREEAERTADRLTVAPEIGVSRQFPPEAALAQVRQWIATGVFQSVDLYDDENLGDLESFVPLYRMAEEHGLRLKAHAGELCGAASVRRAVEALRLHAVQHGIRAAEDPTVMDFLAERGTVLNVCPTSNCALAGCETLADHPARRLFAHGVTLTVNSDDFTIFGAGVSDEILNLVHMGFTATEITTIVENGLRQIRRDSVGAHSVLRDRP